MTAALIDTNLLVYGYFAEEGDGRVAKARTALTAQALAGTGHVAVQNLAELCAVCMTKLKPKPPVNVVRQVLSHLSRTFTVIAPGPGTVAAALDATERHRLSFWDAMLWAVAKESGVTEILTEDFEAGREIEGIRFVNPLS